jgi:stage II sporulation protein R
MIMNSSKKQAAIIVFIILMLVMSWESQKIDAAVIDNQIPSDAIRLRILANSDGAGDQVLKRRVRDAVVEQMNDWVTQLDEPQNVEHARKLIASHLSEIEATVGNTLKSSGYNYTYHVELGKVPFPTKMYGGAVYPAGDYEAVRVTLGKGEGKNWWCVLFPPLCFVDAGSGDALASADAANVTDGAQASPENTEVRFFLWDILTSLWGWVTGLFA